MHNAKAGGEFGANGEWYKGGQFVADSENTVKGRYVKKGPRRINVEPYKWVAAERDTFAVYQFLEPEVFQYRHGKKLDVQDWQLFTSPERPDYAFMQTLLDMYKSGRRTIGIQELANVRVKTGAGPYWIENKLDVREFATV